MRGAMVGSREKWVVRASMAGLLVVLCLLAGFPYVTQHRVAAESKRADTAIRLSAAYQDARTMVTEAKSLERRYHFEGSEAVRTAHDAATRRLAADLRDVMRLDPSPAARATVDRLLFLQARYVSSANGLFSAIDVGDEPGIQHLDHEVIDPIFGVLEYVVHQQARAASARALEHSASLRHHEARARSMITIAFGVGVLLLAGFAFIIFRARRAEVARLAQIAITDPLTGLRNHRAFQEDLARELQRVGRSGDPLSLVILDVDGLKEINDRHGHQAGDERLQAVAHAVRASHRGSDLAYRVGGDEFAVILSGARALGALEYAQRLRAQVPVTAGIAEATELRSRDELIREAGLALVGAKRIHQDVAVYGPDMEVAASEHEHDERPLASALALAVDAKDSYTRSHCQTVSQLCAVVADELGLDGDAVGRVRLAGLLHDV